MASTSGDKRKALLIANKLMTLKKIQWWVFREKKLKEIADELRISPLTLRTVLKKGWHRTKRIDRGKKTTKSKTREVWRFEKGFIGVVSTCSQIKLYKNRGVVPERATEIVANLNITEFSGSTDWLDDFRNRHGILYRQITDEVESAF